MFNEEELKREMETHKVRHDMTKEFVSLLSHISKDTPNEFRLLELQMEIMDKIQMLTDFRKLNKRMTEKEILEKEKSLLKILDVVNKEVNNG